MLNGPYSESPEPNSLNVRNLRNLSRSKYSPLFTFSIVMRAKRRVAIQLERLGQPARIDQLIRFAWAHADVRCGFGPPQAKSRPAPYSLVTLRPQYAPFDATEHRNNLHGVH
jgi:hypothetical protein